MHKFTQQEDEYILGNMFTMSYGQIGNHLGLTNKQVGSRINSMRRSGMIPDRKVKLHNWTEREYEYIANNYYKLRSEQIAKVIGVSKESVKTAAQKLRKEGRVFRWFNNRQWFVDHVEITDGYPDVPWWMRQSTRSQVFNTDVYRHYA